MRPHQVPALPPPAQALLLLHGLPLKLVRSLDIGQLSDGYYACLDCLLLLPQTGAGLAVRGLGVRRLGGAQEGGVGVGQVPAVEAPHHPHPSHTPNLPLSALEVAIEVPRPAEILVHLAPVVHGDLRVVADPGPLGVGGVGGRRQGVENSLVLLHVDQTEDAGAEQDGEDGEPVSSLAVGGVDVT